MNFAIIKEISVDRMEELMPLMKECLANGQSVTFSPHGVSMLPILREGRDTVTISAPPEKLKKYDIILYQRTNGKYVLHRIVGVGETYTCIGDNQFVLEKGIAREQIIAVCTSFNRKGKEHSADVLLWRLYAVFWHYSRFPRRAFRAVKRRIIRLFSKK
jgi:hypothetical protein